MGFLPRAARSGACPGLLSRRPFRAENGLSVRLSGAHPCPVRDIWDAIRLALRAPLRQPEPTGGRCMNILYFWSGKYFGATPKSRVRGSLDMLTNS